MNASELLTSAVRNNAQWCDRIAASHGGAGQFDADCWWTTAQAQRFYPNAVTLRAAGTTRQLRTIEALSAAPPAPTFAIKDSFACLELRGLGFAPLFDATWYVLEPIRGGGATRRVTMHRVHDAVSFEAWRHAWCGGDTTAGQVFVESLLRDSDVAFVAGEQQGRIVCGAALFRGSGVVSISNLFSDARERTAELIRFAHETTAGAPLVGYGDAAELSSLSTAAPRPLGPLRVWQRRSGESGGSGESSEQAT